MRSMLKLSDVAEIFLGQTFREKAEASDSSSGIRLIQIKDIRQGELLTVDNLPYADIDPSKLKIKLEGEELILPLRGARTEAMMYRLSGLSDVVTTTNQVAIIKPKDERISLEYLHWYFNSRVGRESLDAIRTGATIPNINVKNLSEVDILIPDTKNQTEILMIYDNWVRQRVVLKELLENGEKMVESMFSSILRG